MVGSNHFGLIGGQGICPFFGRLLYQGRDYHDTRFLFHKAIKAYNIRCKLTTLAIEREKSDPDSCVFHHVTYHPHDPSSRIFQLLFRRHIIHPTGEPPIHHLQNQENGYVNIDRLIIAYHSPKKLRNFLFPRKFNQDDGFNVSKFG